MSGEKEKTEINTVTATSTGFSTAGGEGVLTGIKVKHEGSAVRKHTWQSHTLERMADWYQEDLQEFDDQLGNNVEQ